MGVLRRNDIRGSVLILSIWILALLSLLSVSLSSRVRIELRLSHYPWDELRLAQTARRAVQETAALWRRCGVVYTARSQRWNNDPAFFKDHALPEGSFSALHEGFYGADDESARVHLNVASEAVLRRLLGSNAEVVPAILEWRASGVGADGYARAGYAPRRGPFRSVEELLLVRGMTPERFEDAAAYLTTYGPGNVNLNTASRRVLEALGLSVGLAGKILIFRQGRDGREGTEDDGVFQDLDSAVQALRHHLYLSERESREFAAVLRSEPVGVQSSTLRLHLTARLKDSRSVRQFQVVASAQSIPARILYWREMD